MTAIYNLKRGQRFQLPKEFYDEGEERPVFTFEKMDGTYGHAKNDMGFRLVWAGPVEPVDGE